MYEAWAVWDGNRLLAAFDGEDKANKSVDLWNDKLNIDTVEVTREEFEKPHRNFIWFTKVDGAIETIWATEAEAIEDKNWMLNSRQYEDCEILIDKIAIT